MDNKNKKDKIKERKSRRTRLIALIVIGTLFLMFGSNIKESFQIKVPYNEFITMMENDEIETADIDASSGKMVFTVFDSNAQYRTNYPYSENFVEKLLVNGVDVKTHETNWLFLILRYFGSPILMLILIWFIMTRDMVDFDVELVEHNGVKFDDIAGMNEIKEDMLFLSEMMKNEKYRESGARVPRGVLLQGPPGNGKTLLAKAFAGETGVNFIAVNASDFGSQFVGIGSSKIKKVFDTARKNAPCVIFIDELDSVGSRRSSNQDSASKEMNTMLTALLNQMDGFKKTDNIMVLAATNRIDSLDEALIRPGRFDRQFVINHPDFNTRKEILKLYTKNTDLDNDVDFERLAHKTFGFSASKIECIVNEANILSIRDKRTNINNKNFEDAILQMTIKGHLKKSFNQTNNEKEITAYHEAGHAVVTHILTQKRVSNISIIPTTSGAGGFTITEEDEDALCPLSDYKAEMAMLYAGRAAETLLRGGVDASTTGPSNDIERVTRLASAYVKIADGIDYSVFGDCGVEKVMSRTQEILKEAWDLSLTTVKKEWDTIEKVAQRLMKKETLTSSEFVEIIK